MTLFDNDQPIEIPERLVHPVLEAALEFLTRLGDRFSPDVDTDDNRILFYHGELWRGVQLRWHDGELIAFMGERVPDEEVNAYEGRDDRDLGFDDAIARVRTYCERVGIKIEAEYDYPFDGPTKGTLTGIGKHPNGRTPRRQHG